MTIQDPNKISIKEADRLMDGMASDLTEYYRSMQTDVLALLAKAQKEGWQEDKYIAEVEKLFEEPNGG